MQMNVIIISHDADVDGIFSLAIGLMKYPRAKTFLTGYGKENFKVMLEFINKSITSSDKNLMIISDLGMNDNYHERFLQTFRKIKGRVKIIWIDHHNWLPKTEFDINREVELILDRSGTKCATELMYERFAAENQTALVLSKIAHTADFFINDQYLPPLPEIIKYYNFFPDKQSLLYDVAKNASKGILWNVKMQKDYNEFSLLRDKAKKHVFENMKIRNICGFMVVFIKSSPYLQTSIFSEEVFKKTNSDIAIFYDDTKKISIRRGNDKISCSEIANNLFEGGGHSFAAGAYIKSGSNDVEEIIKEVQVSIRKTLYKGKQ